MSLLRINTRPSRAHQLLFGMVWLLVFSALALKSWRSHRLETAIFFGSLAAAVLPGFFYASWMRWLFVAACYATYPIGFVVSHVALGLVYFLVMTPIGLGLRIFGRDPLMRRFDPKKTSYWQERERNRPAESYFRQY